MPFKHGLVCRPEESIRHDSTVEGVSSVKAQIRYPDSASEGSWEHFESA